jgi:Bifunctional DNA primase/polymerase, N-terminal
VTTRLDVALLYAQLGFRVVPCFGVLRWPDGLLRCACPRGGDCGAPGKHPLLPRGVLDASRNPVVVAGWWQAGLFDQAANLAVATGQGIAVVDVDTHGTDGPESWFRFCLAHGLELGGTLTADTPSGGRHLFLGAPPGSVGSAVGVLPGVDVRGEGGYVLVAPSLHVAGVPYRWRGDVLDTDRILPCPPEVVDLVGAPGVGGDPARATGGSAGGLGGDLPDTGWLELHGLREGSRDTDCYRLACRLWQRYGLDGEVAVVRVVAEAWSRRAPGTPDFTWQDACDKIRYARAFVARSRAAMDEFTRQIYGNGDRT